MRSGLIRLPRRRRWLRRLIEVFALPGDRTRTVTARTPAPEISISVRRRPAAGRVTIEEVRR
jgi:hypothetical protein